MIPCYICKKDASAGWTTGFAPAPDSQKLALCAEHDTPENRRKVEAAWRELQEKDLAAYAQVTRQKAAPHIQVASVRFAGGGMLSFTCTSAEPTPQGTLRIEQADGSQTFIPMQHIINYALRPFGEQE
jgi:hypothetical protein